MNQNVSESPSLTEYVNVCKKILDYQKVAKRSRFMSAGWGVDFSSRNSAKICLGAIQTEANQCAEPGNEPLSIGSEAHHSNHYTIEPLTILLFENKK